MNTRIWLIDSTLRDGEQAPGLDFSRKEKEKLAVMLAEAGIDESEVGTPAMGRIEQEDIRAIVRLRLPCRLTCWCRAKKEDIGLAADCNSDSVHISFPVSPILMNAMNKDESWVFAQSEELIPFALRYFKYVSVGAQDATRADIEFLKKFARLARDAGAYRLRIADTVGIATPFSTGRLVRELSDAEDDLILEFHAHNDLGMATGNAISAMESGASALSVTVNGLGERAGNAALEEVVAAIAVASPNFCRIEMDKLIPLCRYVAELSKRPIPPNKPITGEIVFTHESGIHCNAMLQDPRTYQPFSSEMLGRTSRFVIGKHSGSAKRLKKFLEKTENSFSFSTIPFISSV